jgi:hypothetical protein
MCFSDLVFKDKCVLPDIVEKLQIMDIFFKSSINSNPYIFEGGKSGGFYITLRNGAHYHYPAIKGQNWTIIQDLNDPRNDDMYVKLNDIYKANQNI